MLGRALRKRRSGDALQTVQCGIKRWPLQRMLLKFPSSGNMQVLEIVVTNEAKYAHGLECITKKYRIFIDWSALQKVHNID
jgi:hypothetical protein